MDCEGFVEMFLVLEGFDQPAAETLECDGVEVEVVGVDVVGIVEDADRVLDLAKFAEEKSVAERPVQITFEHAVLDETLPLLPSTFPEEREYLGRIDHVLRVLQDIREELIVMIPHCHVIALQYRPRRLFRTFQVVVVLPRQGSRESAGVSVCAEDATPATEMFTGLPGGDVFPGLDGI